MRSLHKIRYQLSRTHLRGPVTRFRHRDVKPDDLFMASYPRSGSTWLRFVLQEVLTGDASTFPNVNQRIPQVGFHQQAYRIPGGGRLIKTHESYRPEYKRAICLVRDARDVLLSEYAYQTALGLVKMELDEYIQSFLNGQVNPNGAWPEHVASWLDAQEGNPAIRLVKFEDLRRDTAGTVAQVLEFMGVPVNPEAIRAAIDNNGVQQMRAKELQTPQKSSKGGKFIREGSSGGWRKNLTLAQARLIEQSTAGVLKRLSYPLAEEGGVRSAPIS